VHYWIINSEAPALMGPLDLDGTWWFIAFGVDQETGEQEAARLIDAAAGVASGAVVRSTDPWTARMQIADRMRRGRVFLAGDAAHLNPPFGGHGLNTGLGDAVDLGWKLAARLGGWGGPALLGSYQAERRPIQERVIREATANMAVTSPELLADNLDAGDAAGMRARRAAAERIQQAKRPEFHSLDLVLGVRSTAHRSSLPARGQEPCCRTPGSLRAGRCTTPSALGSRCLPVRAPAAARSSRRPAPGACRCASSKCPDRMGPRSRWSVPTSTSRGPATASPPTAWP
jgi:hypothetical protein